MAVILKLKQGDSGTELNMNAADDAGWQFANQGWIPQVAEASDEKIPPPVTEVLDMIVDHTSDDNLATQVQNMNDMRMLAQRFIREPQENLPVWMHAKMDGETGGASEGYRSLVRKIVMHPTSPVLDATGEPAAHMLKCRLEIEREPYWEPLSASTAGSDSSLSVLGGAFDYTAGGASDVVGDAPARIKKLLIDPSRVNMKLWMGFRSANRKGTLGNFQPLWEIEDAGALGNDASKTTDATASPGGAGNTKVAVSFSTTATWAYRAYVSVADAVGSNYSDQYGRFLVLMRTKVGASTNCKVYLTAAMGTGSDYWEGPIREITATSYDFYDMGIVSFPPIPAGSSQLTISEWTQWRLGIYAKRDSGSNGLHLDCLVLIPIDELFIGVSSAGSECLITTDPANRESCYLYNSAGTAIENLSAVEIAGGGVPIGDGRMYLCVGNAQLISDTYDATIEVVPRWHMLRGSE